MNSKAPGYLLLIHLYLSIKSSFSSQYGIDCAPAECYLDASCYCSRKQDYVDIGRGGQRQTQRCNDDDGFLINGQCMHQTAGGYVQLGLTTYDYVYKTTNQCLPSNCPNKQFLSGCSRYNPGTCKDCSTLSTLQPGHYWGSSDSNNQCIQTPCTVAPPGYFISAECGKSQDAEILPCRQYKGNPDSKVGYGYMRQSYCPGQSKVLEIPDNAQANQDYSFFTCNAGYYLIGTEGSYVCHDCPTGSACLYNKQYLCPKDYYNSAINQNQCMPCSASCSTQNQVINNQARARCKVGSIQDAPCVMCNSCGVWPTTGLDCVQDPSLMPTSPCTPCNTQDSVATCC